MYSQVKNVLFLLVFICSSSLLFSQEGKKTVILIEGEATEVNLASYGEILKVYRKIPGYMTGFIPYTNQSRPDAQAVWPNNKLIEEVEVAKNGASFYNVFFEQESGKLSEQSLEKLDKVIEVYNKRVSSFLLISSYYTKGDRKSQQLANERIEVCQNYLQKANITNSKMVISVTESSAATNNVQIKIK